MTDVPTWSELITLMVHGPDLPMRGRIRHDDGGEGTWFAYGHSEDDPGPVFARGGRDSVAVWRDGSRIRLEDPDGEVTLICDGETAWSFPGNGSPPLESRPRDVVYGMTGTAILQREGAERWLGDDFTRPTGPATATVLVGRPAWTIELAPPRRKPHPLRLGIDAETGMLLQERVDGAGIVTEWTELVVGDELDAGLFVWDGPVVSWDEQRAERRLEQEVEARERSELTRAQLGLTSLVVPLRLDVDLHLHEADGTLHARISDVGTLLRRPCGDAPWEDAPPGAHRWSDDRWDWAIETWDDVSLDDGALVSLEQQLSGAAG